MNNTHPVAVKYSSRLAQFDCTSVRLQVPIYVIKKRTDAHNTVITDIKTMIITTAAPLHSSLGVVEDLSGHGGMVVLTYEHRMHFSI